MNIYVILNGAQRSEESRRLHKERFFASLRMTKNSLLIAHWYKEAWLLPQPEPKLQGKLALKFFNSSGHGVDKVVGNFPYPVPHEEKEMLMQTAKQLFWTMFLAALLLFNCTDSALGAAKLVKSQTVYIPSYANVISGPPIYMVVPLRANLVIHNTDPDQSISIARIDEYNTEGQKVVSYLTAPVTLNPLGAMRVVVKESKKEAEGLGANFIIQWQAEKKVNEPIIECLIIGSLGAQGFSFTTLGRIIKEQAE